MHRKYSAPSTYVCVKTTNASKGNCSVLSNIHLPKEAILCEDANCTRVGHKRDLCSMYDNVVSALYDGGKPFHKHDTEQEV